MLIRHKIEVVFSYTQFSFVSVIDDIMQNVMSGEICKSQTMKNNVRFL